MTEWDKLTQPVLEAGRNSEGQQIIPLSYTFPLLCYPKSEWEHIPDKTYTWGDMLNHSALLPHSLDLANCGSSQKFMDVSDSDIDIVAEFSNSPDYLEYIMGSFADFETEELGFTEEELLECVKDIISLEPKDNFEEFDDARETYVGVDLSERTFNKPMTFLPLYNVDGGVTAHIEEYAAINRNTEKPEEAFKVIDLLMSKYVQQWSSIYHDLLCLYRLIPMHEELFQESNPLVGYNYYMQQDNYEAFCKMREQITAEEVLEKAGIAPVFTVRGGKRLDVRMLEGKDYHLACLVNYDSQETPVPAGAVLSLCCGAQKARKVTFYTPEEEKELSFTANGDVLDITLPEVKLGGFILIQE